MRPTITAFLMFDGKAEEAIGFYVSLFPNSAVTAINDRYGVSWQLNLPND